jgi:hypothetical protein
VCTKLSRGGPNNATYIVGYTILDREHVINVGIEDIGTQLTGKWVGTVPAVQARVQRDKSREVTSPVDAQLR